MKFRVIISVLCLLFTTNLLAQEKGVNKFEIGGGYAPFFINHRGDGLNKKYDINVYAEWRHSVNNHISFGTRYDDKVGPSAKGGYVERSIVYNGNVHIRDLLAVADFSFLNDSNVSGFLNIGAGPGVALYQLQPEPHPFSPTLFACLNTRIGVELFKHLRLAAGFDLTLFSAYYWPVTFTAGWVF